MLTLLLLSTISAISHSNSIVKRRDQENETPKEGYLQFQNSEYSDPVGGGGSNPRDFISGELYAGLKSSNFTGFGDKASGGSYFLGFKSGNFTGFGNKAGGLSYSGFQAAKPRSKEVAPGVFSFTSSGFIISLFIVTEKGVMVIDPMKVEHAKAMLEEIRRISKAPIKFLFYSHDHWDHTIGGQVFKDEGATIVSHIDAYDWIKANPTKDLLLPDETWVGRRSSYTLGHVTLDLHHEGLSHGSGMTTFVLPKQKVNWNSNVISTYQSLSLISFRLAISLILCPPKQWATSSCLTSTSRVC